MLYDEPLSAGSAPMSEGDFPSALPAEAEAIETALPAPALPHPGFGFSILWCLAFLAVLYGSLILTLLVTAAVQGALAPKIDRVSDSRDKNGVAAPEHVAIIPRIERDADRRSGVGTPGHGTIAPTVERDPKSKQIGGMVTAELAATLAPAMFVGEAVSVIFALLIIRIVIGRDWVRKLGLRPPGTAHVVLTLLSLPALLYVPSGVHELAKQVIPPLLRDNGEMADLFRSWPAWLGVLVVGIGPGLGEELWCRGFLGRGLVGRYGVFAGILLTSMLFGLLHIDPAYAVATCAMGIWLHFVYLTSRSLWLPMFLHLANNSIAVLATKYSPLETLNREPDRSQYLLCIAAFLLMLAIGLALYKSRARLVQTGDPEKLPWHPDFPGVEHPPAGRGTILIRPWPGWLASSAVAGAVVLFASAFYILES